MRWLLVPLLLPHSIKMAVFLPNLWFPLPLPPKKRGWNSGYKGVLSNKHQYCWVQFVHCSTLQSRSKISSCGVTQFPLKHYTAGSHCGSTDKAVSGWVVGWLCAWCLGRRSCPEVGGVTWLRRCWLEDEGVCDKRCDKTGVQWLE